MVEKSLSNINRVIYTRVTCEGYNIKLKNSDLDFSNEVLILGDVDINNFEFEFEEVLQELETSLDDTNPVN